jgi:integrase
MTTRVTIDRAQSEYEKHLRARGLAPRSVKSQMQTLNHCRAVWGDTQLVSKVRPEHLDQLFIYGDWSPNTRNLHLSNLRGFFTWARRNGYVPKDYDPTEGWRNVRAERKEKTWLPIEQFADLLNACDNGRDRAIIAIGLFTFMRGSEVSTLRVRDVDFQRHTVEMYRHKTKQQDVLPLSSELHRELLTWLNEYELRVNRPLNPDWYLVPAQGPLPMTFDFTKRKLQPTGEPSVLRPDTPMGKPYEVVKRAMRRVGMDPHGSGLHTLRRSGARALFDRLRHEGYDGALMRVSSMLGHADTKTTEIYLGLSIERQQRNELIAGKPMFPDLAAPATVVSLKEASGG